MSQHSPNPRITCLVVTKDVRRLELLVRSIDCYCRQSFEDRELLVLSDGTEEYARAIDRHLASLGRNDVRHVHVPGKRTLGEARNLGIQLALGEYICQWDDDDLNHPHRLDVQYRHMRSEGAEASFLEDQWQYFYDTGELLWISWRPDLIPGTLLCSRALHLRYPYVDLAKGEDACMREALRERENIAVLSGYGYLSLYTYSGLNVYSRRHHHQIRLNHDPGYIRDRIELVHRELPEYGLDPAEVRLTDESGTVADRMASRLVRARRKSSHRARTRDILGSNASAGQTG